MTLFPDNSDFVFLFPGIGVQPFGGEQQFYRRYRSTMEPFLEQGSAVAGNDLCGSLLAGELMNNEQLSREIFSYSFSHGTYRVLEIKGLRPQLMAGHSLGVYAALSSSGAISFEDGLRIIYKAHELGRQHSATNDFGVIVIIGLRHNEVMDCVRKKKYDSVNLANLNSHSSCVYVGYRDEINALLQWAEEEGAIKIIRLRIDIPFHSPLFMGEASKSLKSFLSTLSWHRPQCPILSALDQCLLCEHEELIEMTAQNLSQSINWPGLINKLADLGTEAVIECGAGVSLTQHGRFIEGAPRHYNLKNMRRRLNY